jgi:hypothetical protein
MLDRCFTSMVMRSSLSSMYGRDRWTHGNDRELCVKGFSPAGAEPKDSARALVAVISGVGTLISLAFLVGDLVHNS